MLLGGLRIDGKWPWAWLLLGPCLGAPAWSSRLFPSPALGWDVICRGCFAGAHRTRALCSKRLTLRVRRQQGLRASNAFARGVEGAARVPLALQAQGDGAEHVPPPPRIEVPRTLLDPCPIQPPPCIPGVVQNPQEREERAVAVGSAQGQRVPKTGWLCSCLPPPTCVPKVFPYQYFFFFLTGCRGNAARHARASVSPGCTQGCLLAARALAGPAALPSCPRATELLGAGGSRSTALPG